MLSTVLVYIKVGYFVAFENVYRFIVGKRNIDLVFNHCNKSAVYCSIFLL